MLFLHQLIRRNNRTTVVGIRVTRMPPPIPCFGGFDGLVCYDAFYPWVFTNSFIPAVGIYTPAFPEFGRFTGMIVEPIVSPSANVGTGSTPPQPRPEPRKEPTASNASARARSGRYLGHGDALFARQNYRSALDRYKTAAGIAPDTPEPFLRQAFSQVALGQHARAAKAFRRGLAIRDDWTGSPLRLDELYGDDRVAKTAHVEKLARAIEENPFDAELQVVLALVLYFDGQPERAEVFFARAVELGANEDRLLSKFLPAPGPADARGQRPMPEVKNNKGAAKVVF